MEGDLKWKIIIGRFFHINNSEKPTATTREWNF